MTNKELEKEVFKIKDIMQAAIAEGANALSIFSKLDILFGQIIDLNNRVDKLEKNRREIKK